MGGYAIAYLTHELDDTAAFMDRGLLVNPNQASAWMLSAWLRVLRGEPDLALEHTARAIRLSPLDPHMSGMHAAAAYAHFLAGRYEVARSTAEQAIIDNPDFLLAICVFTASSSLTGRLEHARRGAARALQCNPDLRVSNLRELLPFRRAEDLAPFAEALRKAGLPE